MSPPVTGEFLDTIETIRQRARAHIEKVAVTEGYRAPLETVIRLLEEGS